MSNRELTSRGFDWRKALEHASKVLEGPPGKPWIERPAERGWIVAMFALPVALCPTSNGARRKPDWWYAKIREEQFRCMLPAFLESGLVRGKALPGRPQVHAVKLSPRPTDAVADFAKGAIDRLILPLYQRRKSPTTGVERLVDMKRFGILRDDNPEAAEVRQWWEPTTADRQCVVVILRSGE